MGRRRERRGMGGTAGDGRRTTDDGAAPGICCMSTATAAEGRARRLGRLVRVRRCVRACVAWRAPGEGNRVETTDGCGSGSGSGSDGRAPAGGPPLSKGESAAGGLIGWRTCSSGGGAEPWRYVLSLSVCVQRHVVVTSHPLTATEALTIAPSSSAGVGASPQRQKGPLMGRQDVGAREGGARRNQRNRSVSCSFSFFFLLVQARDLDVIRGTGHGAALDGNGPCGQPSPAEIQDTRQAARRE